MNTPVVPPPLGPQSLAYDVLGAAGPLTVFDVGANTGDYAQAVLRELRANYLLKPKFTIQSILGKGLARIDQYREILEQFVTTNYLATSRQGNFSTTARAGGGGTR